MSAPIQYSHYKKDVSHLQTLDIYRILQLYNVTDPCLAHAIKKLLCPGGRGAKSEKQDIIEAIATLNRRLDMYREDEIPQLRCGMREDEGGIGGTGSNI